MDTFDRIWKRARLLLAFAGGMAIMAYETLGATTDRPELYVAAIGMMGLPGARALEQFLVGLVERRDPEFAEYKRRHGRRR